MSSLCIPRYASALFEVLHLRRHNGQTLALLDETEWQKLLALCDSTQITLLLGHYGEPFLPEPVRSRIKKNSLDNAKRFERLMATVGEIGGCLAARSVDFCVLKGFTHSPDFTPDPLLRAQGDIDLWCLPDQIGQAHETLLALGYRAVEKSKGRHLDPMIRETEWEWKGDYFAPDLPIPVDLHFNLWDEKFEFIPGPDENAMWRRRTPVLRQDRSLSQLDDADALIFAVLHFMMHLLHGDLRLQRAWELAHFLHCRSTNAEFWHRWEGLYSSPLLQIQAIAFDLVRQWFGCELSPLAERHIRMLPKDVRLWLSRYGSSPVEGLFEPNKDELWLNLCLMNSFGAKMRVLFRRLLPAPQLAKQNGADAQQQRQFIWNRCRHHLKSVQSTCFRGLEWYCARMNNRDSY